MTAANRLLDVKGLSVRFGAVRVLDRVGFHVDRGEVVALVGESGSGKSVTALSLMRLLGAPGVIEEGSVSFAERDLLKLPESAVRALRGSHIAMVFQEPMTSLNPVLTVGFQVAEVLETHAGMARRRAMRRAVECLELAGIPDAATRASSYPHELSGGMRQRVMIAMAVASEPELLIADEATTALDVSIQAQILTLMKTLRTRFEMSLLLITHDMGVVASIADRVVVMYAGQVVETGVVAAIFDSPRHPYTRRLLECAPSVRRREDRLTSIPGTPPRPEAFPSGCRFHPRCSDAVDKCGAEAPPVVDGTRCWLVESPDG